MRQDLVAFARLLAEIRAEGLGQAQIEALGQRLGEPVGVVWSTFERARVVWERAQRQAFEVEERRSALEELSRKFGPGDEVELSGKLRESVFSVVQWPRFVPIAEVEVPGAQEQMASFYVQGSARTELSDTVGEMVSEQLAELGLGGEVEACERLHVGQRRGSVAVVRKGVLAVVDWRGLRVSREFAVE